MEEPVRYSYEEYFKDNQIHIETTESKGRSIIADKHFQKGTDIIQALPFVCVPYGDNYSTQCSYCLKTVPKLVRCSRCKCMRYCSSECQKLDWPNHKLECASLASIYPNRPSPTVMLLSRLLRCLCLTNKPCSYQFHGIQDDSSIYIPQGTCEDILSLIYHMDGITPTLEADYQNTCMLVRRLINNESWSEDHTTGRHIYILIENMITLLRRISCNSFSITDDEQRVKGIGLYPVLSFFNHSCLPNCTIIYKEGIGCIRTLSDIQPGEELTISYIDEYQPTFIRQEELITGYSFKCSCPRCTNPILEVENNYQTILCMDDQCKAICTPLHNTFDDYCCLYKCTKCQKEWSWNEFKDRFNTQIDLAKVTLKDSLLKNNPNDIIKDYKHILNLYEKSASPSFHEYFHFLKYALYYMLKYGEYDESSKICDSIINVYTTILDYDKKTYKQESTLCPILSTYLAIKGKITYLQKDYKIAFKYLEKALTICSITHGHNSTLYNEIKELYDNCNVLVQVDSSAIQWEEDH